MNHNKHTLTEPYTFTKPLQVGSYTYNITNYILNRSSDIYITFLDPSNNILKHTNYTISGELFSKWGYNDNYIFDFIDSNMDYFFVGGDIVYPEVKNDG